MKSLIQESEGEARSPQALAPFVFWRHSQIFKARLEIFVVEDGLEHLILLPPLQELGLQVYTAGFAFTTHSHTGRMMARSYGVCGPQFHS